MWVYWAWLMLIRWIAYNSHVWRYQTLHLRHMNRCLAFKRFWIPISWEGKPVVVLCDLLRAHNLPISSLILLGWQCVHERVAMQFWYCLVIESHIQSYGRPMHIIRPQIVSLLLLGNVKDLNLRWLVHELVARVNPVFFSFCTDR